MENEIAPPVPAQEQHERVVALRKLIARGIPCILWGEDAMRYAPSHRVPTCLFDQQILVPDHLLEQAAAVLKEGLYRPTTFKLSSLESSGPLVGTSPFPKGIRLKHRDIPEEDRYKLRPLPMCILLLPQSYYGLSVDTPERFQSLELGPSLSSLNAGILIPKYHTFLEGLVHFVMYPPTGIEFSHNTGNLQHRVYIEYLLHYRVGNDDDEKLPPPGQLNAAMREILEELQTEDARYYIGTWLNTTFPPNFQKIRDYRAKHSAIPSLVQSNTANRATVSSVPRTHSLEGRRSHSVAPAMAQRTRFNWAGVGLGVRHGSQSSIDPLGAILPLFQRLLRRPLP